MIAELDVTRVTVFKWEFKKKKERKKSASIVNVNFSALAEVT